MSTSTEEIAIDIEALDTEAAQKAGKADEKAVSEPEPVTAESTSEKALSPEEGIEKLKRQLADEQKARQEAETARLAAEARANEAAQAEAKARGEVQTSQLDLIKGAIDQVTQANDALEEKYAAAMAAQDWTAAAKAQREMANNAAKLAQLEAGKTALEKAPKPVPRAPVDIVEQFCAQLSAPSAAWVRQHPEFVRDPLKNQQMLAAHQLAIARGCKADTPEYFASVEKTLDLTPAVARAEPNHGSKQEEDPMADAAKPTNGGGRIASPAAAPVSRGGR